MELTENSKPETVNASLPAIPDSEMQALRAKLAEQGITITDEVALRVIYQQAVNIAILAREKEIRDTEVCTILLAFAPVMELLGQEKLIEENSKPFTEKDLQKIQKIAIQLDNDSKRKSAILKKLDFLNQNYPTDPPRTYEMLLEDEAVSEYTSESGLDVLADFAEKIIFDGRRIWKEIKKVTQTIGFLVPVFRQRYADRLVQERDKQLFEKTT